MRNLLLFTPIEQRERIVEIQIIFFEKGASNHTNSYHAVFSRNSNFKKTEHPLRSCGWMDSSFCNLCDNLSLPQKIHTPMWELCKTTDCTSPVPCDNGSCMTTGLKNSDFSHAFFFWWNLSPCIGKHKFHYFNTDQKASLEKHVFRRVAELVIKQWPTAE